MNNITQQNITFLSDIDQNFEIDKSEKYYYFNLGQNDIDKIRFFISNIRGNDIFLIFPFITTTRNPKDPYLRLSDQFIVTNQSNPKLISDYLDDKYTNCDFYVETTPAYLYFKYKKVFVNYRKFATRANIKKDLLIIGIIYKLSENLYLRFDSSKF
jgi:hypothetical protein